MHYASKVDVVRDQLLFDRGENRGIVGEYIHAYFTHPDLPVCIRGVEIMRLPLSLLWQQEKLLKPP